MSDQTDPRVSFLVGAGRSGTTLLYKLLCLNPDIAYISNYENRYRWFPGGLAAKLVADRMDAKLDAWFNSGNAYFVKRPWVKKIFPTPNEGEPVYTDCGLPAHTAPDSLPDHNTEKQLRRCFATIQERAHTPVFLSKRTANNRRLPMLNRIFPEASYIHLIRDGREVAQSLSRVEWWDNHELWWDGRTAKQMEDDGVNRLTICARNWVNEMEALKTGLQGIAPTRQHELRFEDLMASPIDTLERVLNFLGQPMTKRYAAAIESLGMHPGTPKWQTRWTDEQLKQVMGVTNQQLSELGYTEREAGS